MHQDFDRSRKDENKDHPFSPENLAALSDEQLRDLQEHVGESLQNLEEIAKQLSQLKECPPEVISKLTDVFDRPTENSSRHDAAPHGREDGIRDSHTHRSSSLDSKLLWRCATAVGAVAMVVLLAGKAPEKDSVEQGQTSSSADRAEHLAKGAPSRVPPSALVVKGDAPRFSDIDLSKIAQSAGIHSLSLREVKSTRQISYNGEYAPASPSSAIHLVIASLTLQELSKPSPQLSLGQVLSPVTRDIAADGVAVGTAYTVRDALTLMLRDGNNTAANLLVRALGGPEIFNVRAKNLGYEGTGFFNYLGVPNENRSTPVVHYNRSNLVDLSEAMATLFSNETEAGEVARTALANAPDNVAYPRSIAHQSAYHPSVVGEVGVVEVRGRLYVVGLFVETGGLKEKSAQRHLIQNVLNSVVDAIDRA